MATLSSKDQRNDTSNIKTGYTVTSEDYESRDYCKAEGWDGLNIGIAVSDVHRVSRKAEELASRRYQAVSWLQKVVGDLGISDEPSEEELKSYLQNGMILCKLVNKIHPGNILKIVDNPAPTSPRDGAQYIYQYFENVRNFLIAVEELKLPCFEASDLEQGSLVVGSMKKVVDCILALKSYCDCKENGGMKLLKCRSTSKKPSPQVIPGRPWNVKNQLEKRSTLLDLHSAIESENPDSDLQLEGKGSDYNDDESIRKQKTQKKKTNPSTIQLEHYISSLKDPNITSIQQFAQQFNEVSQGSDTQSLLKLVKTIFGGQQSEEVPMLVEFILKKATYEFERRLALQGEQLKKLTSASNELLRREDRLLSRLKALEALAAGSGEEVKIITTHLQLIKNERTDIEKEKIMHEEGVQKLLKDREEQQLKAKELKNEVESSTRESKEKKLELEIHRKLEWESKIKIKDLMLELEGSVKKGHEIHAALGNELRNLRKGHMKFQECISVQIPAFKNIRCILDITRQDVLNTKRGWKEEMDALQFKLDGIIGAATEYHKVQAENHKLCNTIEELKGKIRVHCRVMPFQTATQGIVDFIGENGDILIKNPHKQGRDGSKLFNFNKVYKPPASQEEVFSDSRQLIRSVLDGFNVCIFAYGQTGSGKTYTMTGPSTGSEEDWGINYRSLNDLFKLSHSRKAVTHYEVGVQMIEIYNEQVRDLLAIDGSKKNLEIRNNLQHKALHVPEANFVAVKSTEDVLELIKVGQKNRATGATALNEYSSRSHSVLMVHVQGTDLASQSILRGCLHLIDLAGSERVDKSEVRGERLREAQHINKSLSALGDVIAALAQKNAHIPYRNSKLTQLLQDSLGGRAKTVMFLHISQDIESYGETVSTLKFGERVASVELGAAPSNRESWEVRELREQIASLQEALARKDVEIGKRDAEIERLQTNLKVVHTNKTLHSLASGKQRLKDSNLSRDERIPEADIRKNSKKLLEVGLCGEAHEATNTSTRKMHREPLFLGPNSHNPSENDSGEKTKSEQQFLHKRSMSIDSQSSIASTTFNNCRNNYTQRKVQRKLMLDREVRLKYYKDRIQMSSNTLLASVKCDGDWNGDGNSLSKAEIHYNAPSVASSLPEKATTIMSKSSNYTLCKNENVKTSSKDLSNQLITENLQGTYSVTDECPEIVKSNDHRALHGSIAGLQRFDVQEDLEEKSSELSSQSQESDTDVSAVTFCEQLTPFMADNRTSEEFEIRYPKHTHIPRPPFHHARKLSNDTHLHASRLRRSSVMAPALSVAKGTRTSPFVGLRHPLKVSRQIIG